MDHSVDSVERPTAEVLITWEVTGPFKGIPFGERVVL